MSEFSIESPIYYEIPNDKSEGEKFHSSVMPGGEPLEVWCEDFHYSKPNINFLYEVSDEYSEAWFDAVHEGKPLKGKDIKRYNEWKEEQEIPNSVCFYREEQEPHHIWIDDNSTYDWTWLAGPFANEEAAMAAALTHMTDWAFATSVFEVLPIPSHLIAPPDKVKK